MIIVGDLDSTLGSTILVRWDDVFTVDDLHKLEAILDSVPGIERVHMYRYSALLAIAGHFVTADYREKVRNYIDSHFKVTEILIV